MLVGSGGILSLERQGCVVGSKRWKFGGGGAGIGGWLTTSRTRKYGSFPKRDSNIDPQMLRSLTNRETPKWYLLRRRSPVGGNKWGS